jgi:HK97 gp10 family phage protein
MPIDSNDFDRFTNPNAARSALEAMGAACMQVAQPNCPVQTGYLKNSHRYVVESDHVDVGVTADYGGHVHNGTSRQKAQPWLKDAAEANRESIAAFGVRAWKGAMGE